jgi:hypothetical protein
MKFIGTNNYTFEFFLKPIDNNQQEEITGFRLTGVPIDCKFIFLIENKIIGDVHEIGTGIYLSEIDNIIEWFESILLNKHIEPNFFFYHEQFQFYLLKKDGNLNKIQLNFDGIKPIPSCGGSSGNLKDFMKKYNLEFDIDNHEIKKIVTELNSKLIDCRKELF